MRCGARNLRRGVMLFAVVVILAVAALAVGALSVAQEAEHAGQVAAQDKTQQRAVAWSGAQAVAGLLAAQRDAIATGAEPELPTEVTLWEADGRTAVVRLLPVGPLGELAVSEMAKRSLSTLTADELALSGVVSTELATAAIARKNSADAVEALVDPAAGLTPALVLGPVVSTIAEGVRAAQEGDRGMMEGIARPPAISDVVTPFEAQRAITPDGASEMTPRVPLTETWTDDATRAIDDATAAGTSQRIRDALQDKVPANETELVRAMATAKLEPAQWGAVLGAVICSTEAIEVARVDFARAPEAVLRTLPGISAEKATQLVQERESLDAAERAQLAWPVVKGVLTPEEFALLAPHLSTHGWLWRVRLVSGTIDPISESDTLGGVQVWDVVIDMSENPPRFASLRDSTLLPVAVALAAQTARERASDGSRDAKRATDATPLGKDEPAKISARPEEPASTQATESAPTKDLLDGKQPNKDKWDRIGDNMRDERTERQRAERERRAARAIGGAPRGGTPASAPSASRSDDESASDNSTSGRTASDAPSAHTPAGGLSGRWRTRGSR